MGLPGRLGPIKAGTCYATLKIICDKPSTHKYPHRQTGYAFFIEFIDLRFIAGNTRKTAYYVVTFCHPTNCPESAHSKQTTLRGEIRLHATNASTMPGHLGKSSSVAPSCSLPTGQNLEDPFLLRLLLRLCLCPQLHPSKFISNPSSPSSVCWAVSVVFFCA